MEDQSDLLIGEVFARPYTERTVSLDLTNFVKYKQIISLE